MVTNQCHPNKVNRQPPSPGVATPPETAGECWDSPLPPSSGYRTKSRAFTFLVLCLSAHGGLGVAVGVTALG